MGWSVYVRKGKVYIPSVVRTTDGIMIDAGPIELAPVEDAAALSGAVKSVIGRGIPTVPPPPRDTYEHSPLLELAGVKSWSTFYKGTRQYGIERRSSGFEFVAYIPYGSGEKGFKPDESTRIRLPPDLPMTQVVDRIVEEIQRDA